MEITELTFFCRLSKHPIIPIDKQCSFAVFENGERAIEKNSMHDIPEWVRNPKKTKEGCILPRFLYKINKEEGIMQSKNSVEINCTYYVTDMTLKCTGIKPIFMKMFENSSKEMFNMLDTVCTEYRVLYKASLDIKVERPWDCNIMADVITNCEKVYKYICVNEANSTIANKHIFPVIIKVGDHKAVYVKGVIMPNVPYGPRRLICKVKLSKLPDPNYAEIILSALEEVFDIYVEMYDKIISVETGAIHAFKEVHDYKHGISALRKVVPDLFVPNYTRECPILPLLVSESVIAEGTIEYPSQSGNFYTAPKGLFVGLKKNRLTNNTIYPYLVTCYESDHMKRKNSKTYAYYNDTEIKFYPKKKPVPRMISMISYEYCRIKPDGGRTAGYDIIEVLEFVLDIKIDRYNLPSAPQLVKQELWDVDDKIIMQAINGFNGLFLSCFLTFRYFEELLKVSIHVIYINEGVFEPMIPRHEGEYIWSPPYHKNIILFENKKTTYKKGTSYYEILMRKKDICKVFDDDNEIVQYITRQKRKNSVPVENIPDDVLEQVIDSEGKCRIVKTPRGDEEVFTRPLCVPVTEKKESFLNLYTYKMNEVLEELKLCTTDCKKTSTEHIKYFPNDQSFQDWLKTSAIGCPELALEHSLLF